MRLRLRFGEHTIGSLKQSLPLDGGLCRKNRSEKVSYSYNPDFKKESFDRMDLWPRISTNPTFVDSVQPTVGSIKKPTL